MVLFQSLPWNAIPCTDTGCIHPENLKPWFQEVSRLHELMFGFLSHPFQLNLAEWDHLSLKSTERPSKRVNDMLSSNS